MQANSVNTLEIQPRPQISLWTIFTSYFIVGLTAFGMAILQKLKALVMNNHWLSEEEMNDGLAMVQLYPGPLMVDFSAYVGYKLRGVMGAILATTGFILPSFVLMSILSAFYFAAGNLPWVHPLFLGLEALVVGVLFNVTLEMGGRNLQTRTQAVIMLLAFGALLFKLNAMLIVLVALALGAWLIRLPAREKYRDGQAAKGGVRFGETLGRHRSGGCSDFGWWSASRGVSNPKSAGWLYRCSKSARWHLATARPSSR